MSQRKPSRPRHTPRGGERLESRRPLAGDVVDPNSGWIDTSQFQPYGYSLLGTQLSDVTAGNGAALRYDVPGNGQPVTGRDLRDAIAEVLAGRRPSAAQQPSMGCSIKWRAR